MASILIVDDEDGMRKSLAMLFKKEGYQVCQAESGEVAIRHLDNETFNLVITDLRMDGIDGIGILEYIKSRNLKVPVIIMTAYGTIESAVSAMRIGAYDYITKPFEYDEILHRAKKAIKTAEIDMEMDKIFKTRDISIGKDFSMIIGESQIIKNIKSQLEKIADTNFTVLLTGETGSGKNLIAKAIHLNSSRASGPFISVNCASIPELLLESELFGHTRGAFTGAILERKGLFEAANGGTILLDEIDTLPKAVQSKLLGVLNDNVIRKVGSNKEIHIDVRVIAATNVDLFSAIRKGEFREDLYYRLNVLNVHIPPLREHKEDIPSLAEHFLSNCKSQQNKQYILGFTPEVIDKLYQYYYPGNIRELFNIVCHTVTVTNASFICYEDLPPWMLLQSQMITIETDETVPTDIKDWEKRIIIQSIKRHPRNLVEVCRELKIGRTTLWRKMKKYNIDIKSVRV